MLQILNTLKINLIKKANNIKLLALNKKYVK